MRSHEPGKQGQALFALLGSIVVTVMILSLALPWAQRRSAGARARLGETAVALARASALERGALYVERADAPDAVEPFSPVWAEARARRIAVRPQTVTMPILEDVAIDSVTVSAIIDGTDILWRVAWNDPEPDGNVDTGRFCDAVALQFPVTRNASFMMGAQDQNVQILHWKALWQLDVDEHFQDVQDVHPNYWTDLYWFAEGTFPYPVPDAFTNQASLAWFPAHQAGNPMSDFRRRQPVEELSAQGYGTLTHQERSDTRARGEWRDGEWAVVFRRPMRTDDGADYQFAFGGRGDIALAVWQGSSENVGGRKHHSEWVEFEVRQR